MFKLLVNAPSGEQKIELVESTGKYFDQSRVIWDERADGSLPVIVLGKMQRVNNSLVEAADYLTEHAAWLAVNQAEQNDIARKQVIDASINSDTVISQFKSMTNAEFDAWWEANVTTAAQAIAVLKRLARVIIRRVL